MEKRVRKHVDNLFKTFEQDEQTKDTKEELVTNLLDRINDSIESGMNENEAFNKAIGNLGTTSELRKIFNFKSITDYNFEYKLGSIYGIISTVIFLILGFGFDLWHPGWAIFILAAAVSNFKVNDEKSYIIPGISVVYIFIGLMWNLWHPGWIIFPVGFVMFATMNKKFGALWLMTGAIYVALGMFFGEWLLFSLIFILAASLVAGREEFIGGMWVFTIAAYLFLGFAFNLWHPGWLIMGIALTLTIIIGDKEIVGATWVASITVYLFLGIVYGLWHPTWVVFLVAAAISAYLDESPGVSLIKHKERDEEIEEEEL